ncbi:uncharacterized protein LOC142434186 isoform X2 [Tenrec ecaudatus]
MCVQICPCLQDKLSALQGAPMEGKVQEMVGLCHELMLCGPDDLDLMKGNASSQKQLYFMDQMLAVIQILRLSDLGGGSEDQDFKNLKEKNEELLGNLFSSPHMQALLQPECDPWPLDAQPVPDQQKDSVLGNVEEKQMANLVKQLQESTAKFQALKAECKEGATATLGDLSTLYQKLRLVISDFHQLIVAFLQVYDDELGGCCHRPEPGLHPCGPIIQAVYQSLTSCSQPPKYKRSHRNTRSSSRLWAEAPSNRRPGPGTIAAAPHTVLGSPSGVLGPSFLSGRRGAQEGRKESFRLPCPREREHIIMSEAPRAETFVFMDLEATGLPNVDPEIAELALFAVHRSSLESLKRDEAGTPMLPRVLDKLTLCIFPERPFTTKASEITGLSRESLAQCRKASFDATVVQALQAFLSRQAGPLCLVAHNGFDYDFPLLCTELLRLGAHLPPDTICLDTLPALRGLDRAHNHGTRAQGRKGYSLGSLFRRYFQAEPSAAHSAEGDVHTLLLVFLHRSAELLAYADEQARSWAHIEPMYPPPEA